MFRKDYKGEMDGLKPSEEALQRTLSAMQDEQPVKVSHKRMWTALIAACLAFALIAVSIVGVFKLAEASNGIYNPGEVNRASERLNSDPAAVPSGMSLPSDYSEIYAMLRSTSGYSSFRNYSYYAKNGFLDYIDGIVVEDAAGYDHAVEAPTGSAPDRSNDGSASGEKQHSDTNNQVAGVQEADIVKNDGDYFYMLCGTKLNIVKADNGKLTKVSSIDIAELKGFDDYDSPFEMLLYGDRLALICSARNYTDEELDKDNFWKFWGRNYYYWGRRYTEYTVCLVYDVSDRNEPKLVKQAEQSGYYVSSRAVGKNVYIVTNHYPVYNYFYDVIEEDDAVKVEEKDEITSGVVDGVIPVYDGYYIPSDRILLPEDGLKNDMFTVISALDVETLESESLSMLGIYGMLYSSADNIYITNSEWTERYNLFYNENGEPRTKEEKRAIIRKYLEPDGILPYSYTNIYRISFNGIDINAAASGRVPGRINDQFNLDERNGYLRIAVNVEYEKRDSIEDYVKEEYYYYDSKSESRVYVLDGSLEVVGRSEAIGGGELLKSSRFIGDIAYVVTFRQTDPLFAIDLSDPANPAVLSELKISGFSTYMQQYGDGLLLGIGYEADVNEGGTTGIKLTMFDISDPTNTFAADSLVYDYSSDWSSYVYTSA
ncbi:MAG: beta-propeller domain-containing protein, partial [Clostridia bacterium]|nr:beta-propeller domain-containing protein [Clostridia bacterium]